MDNNFNDTDLTPTDYNPYAITEVNTIDAQTAKKEIRRCSNRNSLLLMGYLAFSVVFELLLMAIQKSIDMKGSTVEVIRLVLNYSVVFTTLVFLGNIKNPHKVKTYFQKPKITAKKWFEWATIGYSLAMVVNIVGLLVFGAISSAVKSSTGNELQLSTIFPEFTSPLYLAIYVLSVAIFAPIFEELLLRGTLLTHTLKYGQWFSFLAVGISFGLLHGNFQQMFYTATLGIMLCFITFKAKSIIPAIVTHVFINAPTAIATFCMSKMNMEEYAGLAEQVTELQKNGEKVPAELNSEMVDWIGKNLIQLLVVMLIILFMITIFIIGIVNFVGKMRDRREFKCGNCCMVLSGRQKFLAYISGVFTIIFVGVCVFLSVLKAIG